MARIPTIQKKTDLPADAQGIRDEITESRGRVVGPFTVMLHRSELARRIARTGAYVRFEDSLPGDVRELAILSVARGMNCLYEWAAHAPLARKAGVPLAREALRLPGARRADRHRRALRHDGVPAQRVPGAAGAGDGAAPRLKSWNDDQMT